MLYTDEKVTDLSTYVNTTVIGTNAFVDKDGNPITVYDFVNNISTNLNFLINGDTTTNVNGVIDTFKELEKFLNEVSDSDTLEGLLEELKRTADASAFEYTDKVVSDTSKDIHEKIDNTSVALNTSIKDLSTDINTRVENVSQNLIDTSVVLNELMHGKDVDDNLINNTDEVFEFLSGYRTAESCGKTLKDHIDDASNNAYDSAKVYTDDEISKLSNNLNDKIDNVENTLTRKIDDNNTAVNNRIADVSKSLNDLSTYTRDQIKETSTALADLSTYTRDQIKETSTYVQNLSTNVYKTIDETSTALNASIKDVSKDIRELIQNVSEGFETWLTDVDGSISTLKGNVVNINTSISEISTRLANNISDTRNYVDSEINNLKTYTDGKVTVLSTSINDTRSDLIEYVDNISNNIHEQHNTDIANIIAKYDDVSNKLFNKIDTDIATVKQNIEDDYNQKISDLRTDVSTADTSIVNYINNVSDGIYNLLDSEITRIDTKLVKDVSDLRNDVSAVDNRLDDKINNVSLGINNRIDNVDTSINDLRSRIENISTNNNTVNNNLTTLSNRVTKNENDIRTINSELSRLDSKVDSVNTDLNAKINDKYNNAVSYTDQKITELTTLVSSGTSGTDGRLNALETKINNTSVTVYQSAKDYVDNAISNIAGNNSATFVTYNHLNNVYDPSIKALISTTRTEMVNHADAIKNELNTSISNVKTTVNSLQSTVNTLIDSNMDGVINSFNEIRDFLTGYNDSPVPSLQELIKNGINTATASSKTYTDNAINNYHNTSVGPTINKIENTVSDVSLRLNNVSNNLTTYINQQIADHDVVPMSTTTLGIAKVGYTNRANNIKVNVDTQSNLYSTVTQDSIESALGYLPVNPTDIENGNINIPVATTTKVGGVRIGYVNNDNNLAVALDGDNKAFVSLTKSAIDKAVGYTLASENYVLPGATPTVRGGIKVGYGENKNNLAVKLSDEKAYVTITRDAVSEALGFTPEGNYVLPSAQPSELGGIKTGYTNTGAQVAVTTDGYSNAYVNLTYTAIINALGFTPQIEDTSGDINRLATDTLRGSICIGCPDSGTTYGVKLNANQQAYVTIPRAKSSVFGTVKLGNDTVQANAAQAISNVSTRTYAIQNNDSDQLVVNVPWTDTVYTLPTATETTLGGVKLGSNTVQSIAANTVSATAGKSYAVQMNSQNQLVVNVPWVNTTYSIMTTTTAGLGKLGDANTRVIADKVYGIAKNSADQLCVHVPWTDTLHPFMTYDASGVALLGEDRTRPINNADATGDGTGRVYGVTTDGNNRLCVYVPWTDTIANVDIIPPATTTNYGKVKLGTSYIQEPNETDPNNRIYPIGLTEGGQMYVNVPWENTTYGVVTSSADGFAPKHPNDSGKWFRGDGSWANIPTVSNTSYGLTPKLPNDSGKYLNGKGEWTTPPNTTYQNASTSYSGLVKLGSDTKFANASTGAANKIYPVQVDNDNKMWVNVPWNNTTYSVVTKDANGLAPNLPDDSGKYLNGKGEWTTPSNTTYSAATADTLGLVKLGSSTQQTVAANTVTNTADRTYAVQMNSNNQLVVNVPWTAGSSGGTCDCIIATSSKPGKVLSQTAGTNPKTGDTIKCPVEVDSDGKMFIKISKSDIEGLGITGGTPTETAEYVPVFLTLS